MPNWNELLGELQRAGSAHDVIRRRYLARLSEITGRNTIVYYSGWLQKPQIYQQVPEPFTVNDQDKNGFMATIHGMDRSKGLDLLLHTPGGDVAAAESLVNYLRAMFETDIRAVVPQLALSAGTMLACASGEIVMGLHSSIGPTDPQLGGLPAHGVVEEFKQAAKEVREDSAKIPVWQPIIAKYHPTLIGECQKAIKWTDTIVHEWLKTGMFAGTTDPGPAARADKAMKELSSHALTLSHARHIDYERAKQSGLKVSSLEADDDLQDAVLTVHHLCAQTLADTGTMKLIENQAGVSFVQAAAIQQAVAVS
ncbi:MAG: S49 family peptidase [Actinobacteria bacterium]|nr:S49 family peptidase [Actinomycetota bacterium]